MEDQIEVLPTFPNTKTNPEEGPDLEGMEDPFGCPWETIQ
jgi:hypothetical protein